VTRPTLKPIADIALNNVPALPAGGTGTAAGAWDTAANRDLAIARLDFVRLDAAATGAKLNGLLAELRRVGLLET